MSTLRSIVLSDNTDDWSPEDRERPECSALPDSILAELNAFHDANDAAWIAEQERLDDDARCETDVDGGVICPVGIEALDLGHGNAHQSLWVESPRTGRRVVLPQGWWHEWLPSQRILRAIGAGHDAASFTRDELRRLVELADKIASRPRPVEVWRAPRRFHL